MHVEVNIEKEKAKAMPKGSITALQDELTRRLRKKYSGIIVEVKVKGADALYVRGATTIEREDIDAILQQTWESADDWFYA
ncbi:DinI-like family protein [Martelella alba]|uniref:DNA damage-inducible protein I n=1 Tax=Martelella alba TaxID=2590451 RepID=A0ABY2SFT4_9HYPH|nr:DinI-like family protein [Martelella alba]TKI03872.1 DNA damage-inducible protein I [Martelella alba]